MYGIKVKVSTWIIAKFFSSISEADKYNKLRYDARAKMPVLETHFFGVLTYKSLFMY